MPDKDHIKKALLAALFEHPKADVYWSRGFPETPRDHLVKLLGKSENKLLKQDLFLKDDDGRAFIDSQGFWKHFEKATTWLRRNGERLTSDDFIKPLHILQDRNLLQSARDYNEVTKVFSADVWRGNFDDMETLWFKLNVSERRNISPAGDGQIDIKTKRKVLEAENRIPPEDRLAKAGLNREQVINSLGVRYGENYDSLVQRLEKAGDYLRKEYILLPDSVGDSGLYFAAAWTRYDDIVRRMAEHGERFEVNDFTRQFGSSADILSRAYDARALDKVFNPEHWVGRLSDMQELWSHVRPAWKIGNMTPEIFDACYAATEDATYRNLVPFDTLSSKIDLLSPLNHGDGEKPVLLLGLKTFWDKLDLVQDRLSKTGEKIALDDLRRQSGPAGDTCLMKAAKFGAFAKAADLVHAAGDKLQVDDFLHRDGNGNTLLSVLAGKRELKSVFAPNIWVGRLDDMRQLWERVNYMDRHQVDYAAVEVAVKRATVKSCVNDNLRLKPPDNRAAI